MFTGASPAIIGAQTTSTKEAHMRITWLAACSLLVTLTPLVAQAKYVEVWNPPEAQLKSSPSKHTAAEQRKMPTKLAVLKAPGRKIPAARAPILAKNWMPPHQHPLIGTRDAVPVIRSVDIPPLLRPDGEILRT